MSVTPVSPKAPSEKFIAQDFLFLNSCRLAVVKGLMVPRTGIEPVRQLSQPRILSPAQHFLTSSIKFMLYRFCSGYAAKYRVGFRWSKMVLFGGVCHPSVTRISIS